MKAEEFQEWIKDQIILLRDGKVMTHQEAQRAGYRIERAIRLPYTELWIQVPIGQGRILPPEEVINNDALLAQLWRQSEQVRDIRAAIATVERIVNKGR